MQAHTHPAHAVTNDANHCMGIFVTIARMLHTRTHARRREPVTDTGEGGCGRAGAHTCEKSRYEKSRIHAQFWRPHFWSGEVPRKSPWERAGFLSHPTGPEKPVFASERPKKSLLWEVFAKTRNPKNTFFAILRRKGLGPIFFSSPSGTRFWSKTGTTMKSVSLLSST